MQPTRGEKLERRNVSKVIDGQKSLATSAKLTASCKIISRTRPIGDPESWNYLHLQVRWRRKKSGEIKRSKESGRGLRGKKASLAYAG